MLRRAIAPNAAALAFVPWAGPAAAAAPTMAGRNGDQGSRQGRLVVDLMSGVVLPASPGFAFELGDPFAPNPHLATCELIAAADE